MSDGPPRFAHVSARDVVALGPGSQPGQRAAQPLGQQAIQQSLDDLGMRLDQITFVVVDLETTGGSAAESEITEIGAVRTRGGEILGTFGTLVRPHASIPPFIASLTGITDALVAGAPRLAEVMPAFIEFAQLDAPDTVLVAHNAPFDVGFLKAAFAHQQRTWPAPLVLDTARLARTVLHRDEVPNCKLATLAKYFRAGVTPNHRALDDAQATVDVLHGLLERAGNLGAAYWQDLAAITSRVSAAQRTKRHLAAGLPTGPGVYVFRDKEGKALYVGTSRNLRARVRTYFTASEQRARMCEMVRIAERVDPIVCASVLEAQVRELRLIASEQPAYNRRSKRPQAQAWVRLTVEPWPRLSVVSTVGDDVAKGARYLGPYPSRASASAAVEALLAAIPLRTCTDRLPRTPRAGATGCAQAQIGKCAAPCRPDGADAYAPSVEAMRRAMSGDIRAVADTLLARLTALADEAKYETAALWRDRLLHVLSGSIAAARSGALATTAELVAARPTPDNGWELHLIRFGRLAGAVVVPPGVDPRPAVDALVLTGEHVEPPHAPASAALAEETAAIWRWLDSGDVRLVRASAPLSLPLHSGAALAARLQQARTAISKLYAHGSVGSRPVGPVDARPVSRLLTA